MAMRRSVTDDGVVGDRQRNAGLGTLDGICGTDRERDANRSGVLDRWRAAHSIGSEPPGTNAMEPAVLIPPEVQPAAGGQDNEIAVPVVIEIDDADTAGGFRAKDLLRPLDEDPQRSRAGPIDMGNQIEGAVFVDVGDNRLRGIAGEDRFRRRAARRENRASAGPQREEAMEPASGDENLQQRVHLGAILGDSPPAAKHY
jgi:hypothetical protein